MEISAIIFIYRRKSEYIGVYEEISAKIEIYRRKSHYIGETLQTL